MSPPVTGKKGEQDSASLLARGIEGKPSWPDFLSAELTKLLTKVPPPVGRRGDPRIGHTWQGRGDSLELEVWPVLISGRPLPSYGSPLAFSGPKPTTASGGGFLPSLSPLHRECPWRHLGLEGLSHCSSTGCEFGRAPCSQFSQSPVSVRMRATFDLLRPRRPGVTSHLPIHEGPNALEQGPPCRWWPADNP